VIQSSLPRVATQSLVGDASSDPKNPGPLQPTAEKGSDRLLTSNCSQREPSMYQVNITWHESIIPGVKM